MTASTTPRLYPCNRGTLGPGTNYHEFHHAGGGIICRYCGESPAGLSHRRDQRKQPAMTAELPDWVWILVIGIDRFEDEHAKGERCLGHLLHAIPREALDAARMVDHLAAAIEPAQLAMIRNMARNLEEAPNA